MIAVDDLGGDRQAELGNRGLRGHGGWCDGMSWAGADGILYAPTPDSRRENFTVLHEYAHRLVRHDDEALDWLADRADPGADTERLCDEIASILLVPDAVIHAALAGEPPTGRALFELFTNNQASQVACAIALSRHLPCAGAVLLTDRDTHTVAFAAVRGDIDPSPRNGEPLHESHPLRRIAPRSQLRRASFWSRPWGGARHELYLDAYATEKRTYAILAVTDLWEIDALHSSTPPEPDPSPPRQHRRCGSCGYTGPMTGWPCPHCNVPFCRCGACNCARRHAREQRCTGCFLNIPENDLLGGRCSDCRS
ncbi:hypothetical protein [Pseudonocardia sp. 73-21]|uniref:ImmA/IrrE family metallo-endopeptidase n=2 Tax=Pseudonocardia TaxID=1847 RepID=UPI002625A33C|nr:hypothetical protein [Pseudonocardia sp. 73-21]